MTAAGPAVATVQCPVGPDPARNADAIVRAMRRAAARGARIVHLPEGALSGYVKAQIRSWDDVDFGAVCAGLERIAAEARRLGVWAAVGSAHPLTPPNRPHNSIYVISDRGVVSTATTSAAARTPRSATGTRPASSPAPSASTASASAVRSASK